MTAKSNIHVVISFKKWMSLVDLAVEDRADGMTSSDLPGYCYRDCYDDGRTPVSTARSAIRNAKGMDE